MRHQKLRPEALAIVAAGRICFRRLSGTGLSNLKQSPSVEWAFPGGGLMMMKWKAVLCLAGAAVVVPVAAHGQSPRSEEHTSELQSLMRISYAVFCLKKKKNINHCSKQRNSRQHKRS